MNLTSGDVPTCNSKVSSVLFATCNHLLLYGSDARGYECTEVPLSIVHVNDIEWSSILTQSLLLKPWSVIVTVNTPVEAT